MIVAHNVQQIRDREAELMARLSEGALMQRAATGLAAYCARALNGPYGARIVLLVGGGNNGGDALWAGAKLARRGAQVDAVLLRPDRTHAAGLTAFEDCGGRVKPVAKSKDVIRAADVVVDGIYGIGGRPGLDDVSARLASFAAESAGLVVAVDVPSGIDPDTGETPGPHVAADITVTFGTYKLGLLIDPGRSAAGHVELVDIGLDRADPIAEALEDDDLRGLLPRPQRDSDKYRRGVVGVIAGSAQFRGAAILAVGGAVRGGAGMVRFVGGSDVADGVRTRWPEVVVSDTLDSAGRVQAWTIGSGLGAGRAPEVGAVLDSGVPVLIDADGLRHLPDRLETPALLTPHAGELARLLAVDRSDVESRRLHYAREAAKQLNATVLLKGSTTVIAAPNGRLRINSTGTPALSTAGSGDVLAGLCGSLLASGLNPFDAGSVGAHVHGLAGQLAAHTMGYPSAADVLGALPHSLRR